MGCGLLHGPIPLAQWAAPYYGDSHRMSSGSTARGAPDACCSHWLKRCMVSNGSRGKWLTPSPISLWGSYVQRVHCAGLRESWVWCWHSMYKRRHCHMGTRWMSLPGPGAVLKPISFVFGKGYHTAPETATMQQKQQSCPAWCLPT